MTEYFDRGRYESADTPEQIEGRKIRRSLFEAAGLEPPELDDDARAPTITAEVRRDLLALARGELDGDEERRVLSLTRFPSIASLFSAIVAADFRAGHN